MADNNKSSEEDYLDSLLKSVLGSDSGQDDENSNSDDEILGSIEEDLFAEGVDNIDAELSEDEIKGLTFGEQMDSGENVISKQVKVKKEKKHRWGKKNKLEEASVVEKAKEDESINETLNTEPEPEEPVFEEPVDVKAPEGFEDIFQDDSLTEEAPEDEMNSLYDILGGTEPEDSESSVEIDKLEEEKPSRKKRWKKKNKSDKSKIQNTDDSSNESQPVLDDSMGFGIGGLEDIFLGGEEGEEETEASENENDRLIHEMENGDYDEDEILSGQEETKSKKEKKKKEKKEKPKKEKKEKKKKEPKPKKERKPKEPDVVIPISKSLVIFSASVIILIVLSLVLGGKYRNYITRTDAAVAYYLNQDYEAAYNELAGISMHKDDQFFYDKLETIMYVQRHYTSYRSLYKLEEYDKALHTLLRGVKMYDKYKEQAREFDCFEDVTAIMGWIDKALSEKFGLTESQAREINLIENRYEYARKVYEIAGVTRQKEETLKADKKTADGE